MIFENTLNGFRMKQVLDEYCDGLDAQLAIIENRVFQTSGGTALISDEEFLKRWNDGLLYS